MNARLRHWLSFYQYFAGLCDATTGLLLIGCPEFTLRLMGLSLIPQPIAFVRYIGVFVMSVGLSYLWTAARWPLNEHVALVWMTQWKMTALIRMSVAVFITWQVLVHALEFHWITVGLTDGLLAVVQIVGLEQEWIERAA
jgi:uncharacterized protein YjeT (DUF2065 family)